MSVIDFFGVDNAIAIHFIFGLSDFFTEMRNYLLFSEQCFVYREKNRYFAN